MKHRLVGVDHHLTALQARAAEQRADAAQAVAEAFAPSDPLLPAPSPAGAPQGGADEPSEPPA